MTEPRSHASVTITEDPSMVVQCPHCDADLTTILTRHLEVAGSATARFGKRFAYACPACSHLLGISHRKGFWMG